MDTDGVWRAIDAERAGLADLLDDLTPAEWATPSLCSGWRVRDVAAHLTLSHMRPATAVREALRARGNYDRMVHDSAVRQAALPCDEFPRRLRAMVGSRRKVPFVAPLVPLLDVLVHGQDIARPLGRDRPMPLDAAVTAADHVWSMGWPFHAQRRLRGLHLAATDAAWSAGDGLAVEGPISALLLLMTGRDAAIDELAGEGVGALAGGTDGSRRQR
jgi:uncharacterized protein (TIGR03083 family)